MRFVSPNGHQIVGTVERIPGLAQATEYSATGEPEYDGYTEPYWDGQETVTRDGKILYQDENGDEWTFDELSPDTDDEDEEDPE